MECGCHFLLLGVANMAKGKYEEYVKPYLEQIRRWKQTGATDEQIMQQLNLSKSAFYDYQNKHKEFKEVLKRGKREFCQDLKGELARQSFPHTLETKKQYIKQDLVTGHKIQYTEITTKEEDGNIGAIHLLLKNLDENWHNDPNSYELKKQELELRKKMAEENNW